MATTAKQAIEKAAAVLEKAEKAVDAHIGNMLVSAANTWLVLADRLKDRKPQ